MVDEAPLVSCMDVEDTSHHSGSGNIQTAEPFPSEWYIRVKYEFQGDALLQLKSSVVLGASNKMTSLYHGKHSLFYQDSKPLLMKLGLTGRLSDHDVQFLPRRMIDSADNQTEKVYSCYWLIGLPSIPSAELSGSRKFLKEWQTETSKTQVSGIKTTIQAKFVPRKIILEQNLEEDVSALPVSGPAPQSESKQRTGENFKKKAGSNPGQVRKQFIQHAMGGDTGSAYPQTSKGKLRPPTDVLSRLKFDAGYDLNAYVVGYIDRQAGILEKPVAEWQDYEEIELIAYFKHVPRNEIVWDRARKLDHIFTAK